MLRLNTELTIIPKTPSVRRGCDKRRLCSGHIPRTVSFFFGKDGSVGICEVAGAIVNRAAGFGLEIPCVYQLYGRQAYVERLKNLLL